MNCYHVIDRRKTITINFPMCRQFAVIIFMAASNALATGDPGSADPATLDLDNTVYLDQNWSNQDRQYFYFTDQGSRFISYDIFINLEQGSSDILFRDPGNMLRFGYIPVPASALNPDGLPIGFTRAENQVGFTCAACHTQQIKYDGKFIRIDGGQSFADFLLFRSELEAALNATLKDPEKLLRLVNRIKGVQSTSQQKNEVVDRLKREHKWLKDYNRRNHSETKYGYSRLDAFGAILNKGLYLTGAIDNFNPPNAPTSYPYLWDTPQHDYVEWNGSQSNSDVGALARNIGEVIGVFGRITPNTKRWLFFLDGGYPSSIQAGNLRKLEMTVSKLESPLWPESFPPIDLNLADKGRPLYETYCLSCHQDIDRSDPDRHIKVRMSTLDKIQTDPLMARNALQYEGRTGIFAGKPRFYTVGGIMGETAPALYVVNNIMVGVLKNNPLQVLLAQRDAGKLGHEDMIHQPKYVNGQIIEQGMEVSERALLAYKSRPLNGIWAGAPYLHNGSVPNLYQLLLPAAKRDKQFYIGSLEFDPVNVGYVTESVPDAFLFDTTIPGNSNSGHEYGTGYDGLPQLTEAEIRALIEYMKTL